MLGGQKRKKIAGLEAAFWGTQGASGPPVLGKIYQLKSLLEVGFKNGLLGAKTTNVRRQGQPSGKGRASR